MTFFYSASTGGFYDSFIHGDEIPSDATEESTWGITHQELLDGQSSGKVISSNDKGHPILINPPDPTEEQLVTSTRATRDKLIAETDYLLMTDYPITAEKLELVKQYRQLLRDITEKPGFPTDIQWPDKPI
jgi:hypothetical protein